MYRGLFKPILDRRKREHVAVHKVLYHLVRGEYEAVCALLTNNIDLLYKMSSITDLSGRTFEKISPFQYALWSLNKHAWNKMLECIPRTKEGNEVLDNLMSQYKALQIEADEDTPEIKEEIPQSKGVTYTLNEKVITEPHYDFAIIDALRKHANADYNSENKPAIDKQWREEVGGAQRLLPLHIMDEYCSNGVFFPIPDFNDPPEITQDTFDNWTSLENNLPLKEKVYSHGKIHSQIGVDIALYKGQGGLNGVITAGGNTGPASQDLDAMEALFSVRMEDFEQLEGQLLSLRVVHDNLLGPNI